LGLWAPLVTVAVGDARSGPVSRVAVCGKCDACGTQEQQPIRAKTDQPNGLGPHSRNPHRYWARTAQMAQQPNPIPVDKIGSCPPSLVTAERKVVAVVEGSDQLWSGFFSHPPSLFSFSPSFWRSSSGSCASRGSSGGRIKPTTTSSGSTSTRAVTSASRPSASTTTSPGSMFGAGCSTSQERRSSLLVCPPG